MGNFQAQAGVEHEQGKHDHQQRYFCFLLEDSDLAERYIPDPETGDWKYHRNDVCGNQEPEQVAVDKVGDREQSQIMSSPIWVLEQPADWTTCCLRHHMPGRRKSLARKKNSSFIDRETERRHSIMQNIGLL